MWVRENTTKGVSPTGVFRTPSRRIGGAAYTVCYAMGVRTLLFIFLLCFNILCAVIIVLLFALIVIIQFSKDTYQFFPFLIILSDNFIFCLHHSTTSFVSNFRFLLILSIPNSVVCILSILIKRLFFIQSFPNEPISNKFPSGSETLQVLCPQGIVVGTKTLSTPKSISRLYSLSTSL